MSEIVIYQTPDNQTQIDVQFEGETFWLTQEDISQLFERDRTVISKHLRNIFKEGELEEIVVSANFAHTTQHGAIKQSFWYSLISPFINIKRFDK